MIRMNIMTEAEGNTIHTRASLVRGLQSGENSRWQEFYSIYGTVSATLGPYKSSAKSVCSNTMTV